MAPKRSNDTAGEIVQTQIRLPDELSYRVSVLAAVNRESKNDFYVRAIASYIQSIALEGTTDLQALAVTDTILSDE